MYDVKQKKGAPLNDGYKNVDTDILIALIERIFIAAGSNVEEAKAVSTHLVDADCTGHPSHGVVRVTRYLKWVQEGKLCPNQIPEIIFSSETMTLIDGCRGFGQVVAPFAVDVGIEKAKSHGLSMVGIRRSGHLGRIGDWAVRAAEKGIISIHFVNVNGHLLVAPYGGVDRRFSTAPIAIGVPRDAARPLILDFATSLIAEGKALVAYKGGPAIRNDALIDKNGRVSGDPFALYGVTPANEPPNPKIGKGAIRPFGDHKGSGLGFMCEVLAGLLTGSGTTGDSPEPDQLWSGMLSIYIDPSHLGKNASLNNELTCFVDFVKSTNAAEVNYPVLVPGEIEDVRRANALANGIQLPRAVWNDLNKAATNLGVQFGNGVSQS